MKLLVFMSLPIALSACATNSISSDVAPNLSLSAFEEICLGTAPSFAGAKEASAKYGITDIQDMGFSSMGMTKDQSMGVQIKPNNECVITTAEQKNSRLTREFAQLIGRYSKAAAPKRVPAKATVNGAEFIFQHDRQGGEAFVMLKAAGSK